MKKYIVLEVGIALIFLAIWFFNEPIAQTKDDLVIGTASGYAPYVSVNQKGQYEGFDIELIEEVAKKMNRKLVIKDLGSMAPLLLSLEQGSIDAIIWGMSITNDRLKRIDMVRYYGDTTTSYPIMFWENIPSGINSIEDMRNMKISVEPASSQEAALRKYDFIEKVYVEKVDDGLLNIQYNKTHAALVEPAIAKKYQQKYPQIKILNLPLAPEDQVQGVGICIKKNNTALATQMRDAIGILGQEKIIDNLAKKWNIE